MAVRSERNCLIRYRPAVNMMPINRLPVTALVADAMAPMRIGGLFAVDAAAHRPVERRRVIFAAKDAGHGSARFALSSQVYAATCSSLR